LSIHDDDHLTETLEVIDALVAQPSLNTGQEKYPTALTDLVEPYENTHHQIPDASGVDILRYLIEENDINKR